MMREVQERYATCKNKGVESQQSEEGNAVAVFGGQG